MHGASFFFVIRYTVCYSVMYKNKFFFLAQPLQLLFLNSLTQSLSFFIIIIVIITRSYFGFFFCVQYVAVLLSALRRLLFGYFTCTHTIVSILSQFSSIPLAAFKHSDSYIYIYIDTCIFTLVFFFPYLDISFFFLPSFSFFFFLWCEPSSLFQRGTQ